MPPELPTSTRTPESIELKSESPRNEAQNVGGAVRAGPVASEPAADDELRLALGVHGSGVRTRTRCTAARPSADLLRSVHGGRSSPGTLNGVANPQAYLRPKPYKGDFNNPAPNVGIAWNPDKPEGFLGRLLGTSRVRAATSASAITTKG